MLRLGKHPASGDSRDLLLEHYTAVLPSPPARFGHGTMFSSWGMLGNGPDDSVAPGFEGAGDCVFAGAAHETMLWTHLGGKVAGFTGAAVIGDYSAVTGYHVGDDSTDQGTNVRAALKYRQATGVADAHGNRHRIGAYMALRPGDYDQLMRAVYLFGAVGIGIRFPASAMDQFNGGHIWETVPGSLVEGGHYVPVVGRTSRSTATVVTWGRRQQMTRSFYEAMADEAWAFVSVEELRSGKNERGLDTAALNAALQQIA